MSDTMESTGRTVDEAIREALLRMGLRREEVDITVVQEARGGFFGVGKRQAVVKVAKKSSGRSSGRGRSRGRGRGDEGGAARGDRRPRRDNEGSREEARGSQDGRRRSSGGRRSDSVGEKKDADQATGRSRGSRRGPEAEKSDGRGGQQGRRTEAAATQDGTQERTGEGSRRRRPRRRRKPAAEVDRAPETGVNSASSAPRDERPAKVVTERTDPTPVQAADEVQENKKTVRVEDTAAAATEATETTVEKVAAVTNEAITNATEEASAAPDTNEPAVHAMDLVATTRMKPFGEADAADQVDLLTRTATTLMVKSGFQSRVTVTEGEYHQVKMVVDDRSAGVLIGRQGSTVDAIEHIVERIATRTCGDRVKLNLDINNYRNRQEFGLVGRVRNAIAEARNTGEPVAMAPANGRDRRIMHLEVEDMDDFVTHTVDGPDGKYVVICKPDQVPGNDSGPPQDPSPAAPVAEGDEDAPQTES